MKNYKSQDKLIVHKNRGLIRDVIESDLPPVDDLDDLGSLVLWVILKVPSIYTEVLIKKMNQSDGTIDGFLNSDITIHAGGRRMIMWQYIIEKACIKEKMTLYQTYLANIPHKG